MPKKESYQKGMTKKEIYSKLDGLKTDKGKAQYLDKILSKKGLLASETYKAVQDLTDGMYGKMAVEATRKGRFGYAKEFAKKIKDKKLLDEMYGKAAVGAAEEGNFYRFGKFAEKIKDKKLLDEMYGKAAVEAVEKGWFDSAKEFVEKAEEYLKQSHPDILAGIYERAGKATKAKDIRKRLEKGK